MLEAFPFDRTLAPAIVSADPFEGAVAGLAERLAPRRARSRVVLFASAERDHRRAYAAARFARLAAARARVGEVPFEDTLEAMRTTPHLGAGRPHPVVASAARSC